MWYRLLLYYLNNEEWPKCHRLSMRFYFSFDFHNNFYTNIKHKLSSCHHYFSYIPPWWCSYVRTDKQTVPKVRADNFMHKRNNALPHYSASGDTSRGAMRRGDKHTSHGHVPRCKLIQANQKISSFLLRYDTSRIVTKRNSSNSRSLFCVCFVLSTSIRSAISKDSGHIEGLMCLSLWWINPGRVAGL